jgi:hypothetical protein
MRVFPTTTSEEIMTMASSTTETVKPNLGKKNIFFNLIRPKMVLY